MIVLSEPRTLPKDCLFPQILLATYPPVALPTTLHTFIYIQYYHREDLMLVLEYLSGSTVAVSRICCIPYSFQRSSLSSVYFWALKLNPEYMRSIGKSLFSLLGPSSQEYSLISRYCPEFLPF